MPEQRTEMCGIGNKATDIVASNITNLASWSPCGWIYGAENALERLLVATSCRQRSLSITPGTTYAKRTYRLSMSVMC